jgi:hypothetical protein
MKLVNCLHLWTSELFQFIMLAGVSEVHIILDLLDVGITSSKPARNIDFCTHFSVFYCSVQIGTLQRADPHPRSTIKCIWSHCFISNSELEQTREPKGRNIYIYIYIYIYIPVYRGQHKTTDESLSNSMQQNTIWEANGRAAGQETLRLVLVVRKCGRHFWNIWSETSPKAALSTTSPPALAWDCYLKVCTFLSIYVLSTSVWCSFSLQFWAIIVCYPVLWSQDSPVV